MKLKEYLENLNQLVKNNPECLDLIVVSAIDDEGNGFNEVHFTPTLGVFEDREWQSLKNLEEEGTEIKANSVCIN